MPSIDYWEYDTVHITENSRLLLTLLARLYSSGVKIIRLEMQKEHSHMLILNFNNKTFNTLDPVSGCRYGYAIKELVPILSEILGNEWKFTSCKEKIGPQQCTEIIAFILSNFNVNLDDLYRQLRNLPVSDLNLLMARFFFLLLPVFIKRKHGDCLSKINKFYKFWLVSTCSSLLYRGLDPVKIDEIMNEGIENYKNSQITAFAFI